MPPKPKFTKEEIVQTALQVVSQKGVEALTAKELGDALGSSSRPIFTVFNSMKEVQTGYNLSSRNLIWDIGRVGLVVSHNSVNDGDHLPAGVAHGRHVGLPFISFFLKIKL